MIIDASISNILLYIRFISLISIYHNIRKTNFKTMGTVGETENYNSGITGIKNYFHPRTLCIHCYLASKIGEINHYKIFINNNNNTSCFQCVMYDDDKDASSSRSSYLKLRDVHLFRIYYV